MLAHCHVAMPRVGVVSRELAQWLAAQAEELGVDVRYSTAASDVVYDGNKSVMGVHLLSDQHAEHQHHTGHAHPTAQPSQLHARCTLLAEGTHGYLSEVCGAVALHLADHCSLKIGDE